MLKFGKIQEVDSAKGRVQVRFEEDDLVSDWIPYIVPQTKQAKWHYSPIQGEHVACQMDEHCENGVVLGSIYSSENKPNSGYEAAATTFETEYFKVEVNRTSNEFSISTFSGPELCKIAFEGANMVIEASNGVRIKAQQAIIEAPFCQMSGNLQVNGSIEANGEITTNLNAGVSLSTHKHLGVQPGPGVTGTPQPGS